MTSDEYARKLDYLGEQKSIPLAMCAELPGLTTSSEDLQAVTALLHNPTTLSTKTVARLSIAIVSSFFFIVCVCARNRVTDDILWWQMTGADKIIFPVSRDGTRVSIILAFAFL